MQTKLQIVPTIHFFLVEKSRSQSGLFSWATPFGSGYTLPLFLPKEAKKSFVAIPFACKIAQFLSLALRRQLWDWF